MGTIRWVISTAPEIFVLLATALGTFFGRLQIKGFSIAATAYTLIMTLMLRQLRTFVIPPLFKSIFFNLFAYFYYQGSRSAWDLVSLSLTAASIIRPASRALARLRLPEYDLRQHRSNLAACDADTHILASTLTFLFVSFIPCMVMEVYLK